MINGQPQGDPTSRMRAHIGPSGFDQINNHTIANSAEFLAASFSRPATLVRMLASNAVSLDDIQKFFKRAWAIISSPKTRFHD